MTPQDKLAHEILNENKILRIMDHLGAAKDFNGLQVQRFALNRTQAKIKKLQEYVK